MLNSVPFYVTVIFIVTVALTLLLFLNALHKRSTVGIIIIAWLALNAALALNGFYQEANTLPPHFLLAVLPAVVTIILLLTTGRGNQWLQSVNLRSLTLISVVRIPVELVLLWLYQYRAVPQLMTFAGSNFDIISGITAPVIYFICFRDDELTRPKLLLAWNIICLLLLLNVVIRGLLSAPFVFQQFAFDQPNIAVLYFPFVWLPSFIVMAVLFAHLFSIKQIITKRY